jgi:hypothetical protein
MRGQCGGKFAMIAGNRILRHRKDSTRTENRNTLRARFQFMRRVTRNDLLLLVLGVVYDVLDGHRGDVTIWRSLIQKSPHHLGHSKEWRERHPDRVCAHVGARQSLRINICRGLFVEPNQVECLALELLAPRGVSFQSDN